MTPDGSETATTPAIPAQRAPVDPPQATDRLAALAGQPIADQSADGVTQAQPPVAEQPAPHEQPGVAQPLTWAQSEGQPAGQPPAWGWTDASPQQTQQQTQSDGQVPPWQWTAAGQPRHPGAWGATEAPPGAWTPTLDQQAAPGRRRTRFILLASATALAVLLLGFVVFRPDGKRNAAAVTGPTTAPAAAAQASPATSYDKAVQAIQDQSAALLRGDEASWLAAVDPSRAALRTRYRNLFRSLRALGVTKWEYRPGVEQPVKNAPGAVSFRLDTLFCFGAEMCPANAGSDWGKAPGLAHKMTLRQVDGKFLISDLAKADEPESRQPMPWENGELRFAQGRRVVVAAPPGQAKHLANVLKVAETAAAIDDRYATMIGSPQRQYRIFLAGEKEWKSWYGGEDNEWAIGLAVPLNMHGIDVVLRMKEMTQSLMLRLTLQHELGHVVTLAGAFRTDAEEDTWLSEGIAEYIGWKPKSAAQSLRRSSVRWALHRSNPPKSMVPVLPGENASDRAGDAFYGLSHFAADCMATKYGEQKLFAFVKLVLTADNEYDQASREAYGVPFATVDKACLKWVKQQVG